MILEKFITSNQGYYSYILKDFYLSCIRMLRIFHTLHTDEPILHKNYLLMTLSLIFIQDI